MGGRFVAALIALAVLESTVLAQPDPESGGESPATAATAPSDASAAAPDPTTQAVEADPKLAKKLVVAAGQMVAKGDAAVRKKQAEEAKAQYENAVTAYQKALELGAEVAVRIPLAELLDKLGKYDEATRQYQRVVAPAASARPADVKRAAAKLDEELAKVGLLTMNVKPAGATITMGGTSLGTAPLTEPLVLMPGTYSVSFNADGYQPKDVEMVVEAGGELEKAVSLEAISVTVAKPTLPATGGPVAVELPQSPSRVPLYVGGALTLGFTVAAVTTGLLAVGQHTTFGDVGATSQEHADAKVRGERLSKICDATIAGAVVAGAFTTIWYLAKYRHGGAARASERTNDSRAPVMSKLDVAPWVQSNGSGVSLLGAF